MTATSTPTPEQVREMSGPELVKLYNDLTGENVKRFGSRGDGIRRVLKALGKEDQAKPERQSKKKTTKKKTTTKKTPAPASDAEKPAQAAGHQRRKPMTMPAADEIKSHRPGTKRAIVIDLMKRPKGATFEEMMEATGWDYRTCYEGVRLVNTYVGHGLEEDDKGRIRITD